QALELCELYPGLYAMSALHPSETQDATDEAFEQVVELCSHPRVVAVGETGLDYYWDRSFDERQHEFLRRHIRLALETNLPLVFHNREAGEDLIRIVEEERQAAEHPARLRGVFHCFGGPSSQAGSIERLGFHFGVGGTVTFKNSGVDAIVRELPMERIVLETDAPFLAPVPFRGKRNEPAYLEFVADKVALVKEMSMEEVASITTQNAKRLFGI
ncbi:MAG: TatD family hydrolase, partial [Rhodothermales bacterium]|nr:TatD family hydrolase [Rhodothermales bacterium]